MKTLTIGKAARAAGVGVETIRFYERRGLVEQPAKPDVGYRLYPHETVARIRFIQQAQAIGFSLRESEELLSLKADPAADCSNICERAMAKVEDVNRKIADLERVRAGLEEIIAACPGRGTLTSCSILDAIEAIDRPSAADGGNTS